MKRMFISTILILAGLYIMGYPKIIEIFHEQHQQKLIEEWEDSLSIIDHGYMEDEEDIGDIIETQNVNYQEENPTVGQDLVEIEVEAIDEEKKNEKDVYLQSIQMINWNGEMEAIKKAEDLTKNAKTNMEKVAAIYNYIIKNISYDTKKANIINRKSNYIPDIDKIFEAQIGICYDYASLFAAMLRSQGIPTKLVMGYNQDINEYHAWNEVYIEEIDQWVIIDTTYDAGINNMEKVSMIKDAKEYKPEKSY
ncbi:MAG: transglutaminase domain-containing protein [Tissierellia bacterium]|nr:transglutaminase domain-containing protein [Tissierellia bacterium]